MASFVFDSVRPHRRQPTRLPRPWDSPGKNTGVGCHFLLQCMKVKSESEVAQSCLILSDLHGLQPTRFLHPWDFPRQEYWSGVPLPSPYTHWLNSISPFSPPLYSFLIMRFHLSLDLTVSSIREENLSLLPFWFLWLV